MLIFQGKEYLDFIAERVQPWSYLKFPYQKKIGPWQGIVEGPGTNIYSVGPLARMNTRGAAGPAALMREKSGMSAPTPSRFSRL